MFHGRASKARQASPETRRSTVRTQIRTIFYTNIARIEFPISKFTSPATCPEGFGRISAVRSGLLNAFQALSELQELKPTASAGEMYPFEPLESLTLNKACSHGLYLDASNRQHNWVFHQLISFNLFGGRMSGKCLLDKYRWAKHQARSLRPVVPQY